MMSPEIKMAWVMGLPVQCRLRTGELWLDVVSPEGWKQHFEPKYGPYPDPDDQYKYRLAPNDLDPA